MGYYESANIEDTEPNDLPTDLVNLIASLPDDDRKDKIRDYYYHHIHYLPGISRSMRMFDYFNTHKQNAYNVIKTTRAGFTTNCILTALFKNKKILLVAPTNKILYDTVLKAYDLYVNVSKDFKKMIRPIPNNIDGCSCVVDKLATYPNLKLLPFVSADDCEHCNTYKHFSMGMPKFPVMSTTSHCIIKTMLEEKDYSGDSYLPDVITITYDKFATLGNSKRSNFFKSLIDNVDVIIFDEIGDYLSKSYQGWEFFREENDKTTLNSDIILNYLVAEIPNIKNESSKHIMIRFFNEYIMPFFNKTIKLNESGKFPKIIYNSLIYEQFEEKVKFSNYPRIYRASKQELLSKKYREYYETIESLALDNEKNEMIIMLLNLLRIMSKTQLLIYDMTTVKYNPKKTAVHTISITPAHDTLMSNLNKWSDNNKIVVFSDATMPVNNFSSFKAKPIKQIFYGDPSNNNKSLLIYHDQTITNFSKNAFFNSYTYRQNIFNRLTDIIKQDYYGNEVIWAPSKDVATDISILLKTEGIPTCTPTDKPNSAAILITYYGSSYTRGIESNRRIQILLGKASIPRSAMNHVAYMRRGDWSFLADMDLKFLASQEGLSFSDYVKTIKDWSKRIEHNDYIFFREELPVSLYKYFELLQNTLVKEKAYMNSWQAASRSKEPTARNRSVVVCLGWNIEDVHELIRWGSNETISYTPVSGKRLLKTQKNAVPIPNIISSDSFSHIRKWINNNDINPTEIGFNSTMYMTIKQLLSEKNVASLSDIWLSLCHNNIEFDNNSDKENNGYLISTLNVTLMFAPDIQMVPITNRQPLFIIVDNPPKKYLINKTEYDDLLYILQHINLIPSPVSYKDIRDSLPVDKFSNRYLDELWELLLNNNVFNNSTWEVYTDKIIKHTSEYIEQKNLKKQVHKLYENYELSSVIAYHLIEFYFNQKDIYEINTASISDLIPNYTSEQVFLSAYALHSDHRFKQLRSQGLELEIIPSLDSITFSRKNIVY